MFIAGKKSFPLRDCATCHMLSGPLLSLPSPSECPWRMHPQQSRLNSSWPSACSRLLCELSPTKYASPNDRAWQLGYTYAWTISVALCLALSLPTLYRSSKAEGYWKGFLGILESVPAASYQPIHPKEKSTQASPTRRGRLFRTIASLSDVLLWKPYAQGLDLAQSAISAHPPPHTTYNCLIQPLSSSCT